MKKAIVFEVLSSLQRHQIQLLFKFIESQFRLDEPTSNYAEGDQHVVLYPPFVITWKQRVCEIQSIGDNQSIMSFGVPESKQIVSFRHAKNFGPSPDRFIQQDVLK